MTRIPRIQRVGNYSPVSCQLSAAEGQFVSCQRPKANLPPIDNKPNQSIESTSSRFKTVGR